MAYQSSTVFPAIGDPTRRAILDRLRHEGLPVQAIADGFDVSRPAISQHLKVLLDAGLVRERRDGRHRIYSLRAAPLERVDAWLAHYRRFWQKNLESLKEFVEAELAVEKATLPRAAGLRRPRKKHGRRPH